MDIYTCDFLRFVLCIGFRKWNQTHIHMTYIWKQICATEPFCSFDIKWIFSNCFIYFSPSLLTSSVKNCFRVSTTGRSKSQSHSLQANDSFNKQQWISCLRQAMVQSRDRQAQASQYRPSDRLSPDPALYNNIAELNLNSDVEMQDT